MNQRSLPPSSQNTPGWLTLALGMDKEYTQDACRVLEDQYDALLRQARQEVAQVGITMPVVFCFGKKL